MRSDVGQARALGISGVPFFVIDRKYGLSGAQSPDTFTAALERAWQDAQPPVLVDASNAGACGGGGCAAP